MPVLYSCGIVRHTQDIVRSQSHSEGQGFESRRVHHISYS
jgi:hypothetical protein